MMKQIKILLQASCFALNILLTASSTIDVSTISIVPWSRFGGDAASSGYAASFNGPSAANSFEMSRYQYQTYNSIPVHSGVSDAVIDSNGIVYFQDGYHLFAYDGVTTGELKWSVAISDTYNPNNLNNIDYTEATPTIHVVNSTGETVIYVTSNAYFSAVSTDGVKLWSYTQCSTSYSAPVVGSDGTIYLGCDSGYICALAENGTPKWRQNYTLNSIAGMSIGGYGTSDETIYFTTIDLPNSKDTSVVPENSELFAIDLQGTEKWSYPLGVFARPPTVSQDGSVIYATSMQIIQSGVLMNSLSAVNAADGSALFTLSGVSTLGEVTNRYGGYNFYLVPSGVSLDQDGNIYLTVGNTTNSNNLNYYFNYITLSFTSLGVERWKYIVSDYGGSLYISNPTVTANNIVYVANKLVMSAISTTDGAFLWSASGCGADYSGLGYDISLRTPAVNDYGSLYSTSVYGYTCGYTVCGGNSIPSYGGSECTQCPSGEFKASVFGTFCQSYCDVGTYQTDPAATTECITCPYPYTNSDKGESSCDNFCLCLGVSASALLFSSLVFVYFVAICSSKNRMAIFAVLFFPSLDVFSDIAYLSTVKFYDYIVFWCGVGLFCLSGVHFVIKMFHAGLLTKCPAVYFRSPPFPPIYKSEKSMKLFTDHPDLNYTVIESIWMVFVAFFYVLWFIGWVLCQIALLCVPPLVLPLVAVWLVLGIFLHMTKTLCIGKVWNLWVGAWTFSGAYDTEVDLDTRELNEDMLLEIVFESIPQFVLQVSNNSLTGTWNTIGIVSTAISFYITMSGFYKFYYFHGTGIDIRDIPVSVPFMSSIALEPACKKASRKTFGADDNSDGGVAKVGVQGELRSLVGEPLLSHSDRHSSHISLESDKI